MINIILKKAIISEKSMRLAGGGLYTFLVDKKVRKPAISKAVEEKFGVSVVSVKTAHIKGETKNYRTRRGSYLTSGYKKAIVELQKGQKIPLFETKDAEVKEEKEETKKKRSLLKGTKVKIEKVKSEEKEDK